ncbi:MAG: carbonic anhydrase family protein [Proteobacteria bacterium]|nr:carbonic anhydrase family protein [Pseudomonadota bacterium]
MKKIFLIFFVFVFSCKGRWSYESPELWGEREENKFCKIGYNQSPINIEDKFGESDLKFFYQVSDAEKEKKNYVQNIKFDGDNFLLRGKKKYWLRSIVFHHPSEHLIGGEPHSLEMQFYHKSEDEQGLVVAVFIEVGDENLDFEELINFLSSKEKEAKINPKKFIKEVDQTFFYDGSLTTPPCKEGVKWYVMKTPLHLSKDQMNAIIKSAIFVKSNARPVQIFHPEKY